MSVKMLHPSVYRCSLGGCAAVNRLPSHGKCSRADIMKQISPTAIGTAERGHTKDIGKALPLRRYPSIWWFRHHRHACSPHLSARHVATHMQPFGFPPKTSPTAIFVLKRIKYPWVLYPLEQSRANPPESIRCSSDF